MSASTCLSSTSWLHTLVNVPVTVPVKVIVIVKVILRVKIKSLVLRGLISHNEKIVLYKFVI